MPRSWLTEIFLLLGALLSALLLSALYRALGLVPIALFVAWHGYNLQRLCRVLADSDADVPQGIGLWGDALELIYRNRRQMERRLQKLKRRVRRFEESSAALPEGAVALNGSGEIEWLNGAAAELLGLEISRDIGQRITNVVRSPAFISYFEAPERPRGVEFGSPDDDRRVLYCQMVTYRKNRSILVIRDVSEMRRLAEMRRDFIANASHELRTPLTVIKGFLENMDMARGQFPETWHRPLESMRQQADRMLTIITDMLSLARLESRGDAVRAAPVDVVVLLREAVESAQGLGGNRCDVELTADEAWLLGDEQTLRSIVTNLVQNAVVHNPVGVSVRVAWRRRPDGAADLVVRDNGQGIAPEHLDRLTERFYRVDAGRSRAAGGTGLGLAIVKHALSRYGSHLEVKSEIGHGSTFSCRFPAEHVIEPLRRSA
ncbi:MAG: phosphate regulon sensor histidine kinase PhoR [Pseudomonadota bacterium]|nr:phosphate regulon sensor histidine kinase PhoR [Pseudomonadota bacterium]